MPDSSNNSNTRVDAMAPDASTSPVDWSRPIEAVHGDGRVVPAFLSNRGSDDIARVLWHPENANPHEGTFNAFGDALASWPWRIRNVQPTTPERDPALWDRMVALLRQQVAALADQPDSKVTDAVREARAIVADLPKPVDPDLIEARECVAKVYDGAGRSDLAEQTRAGKQDNRLRVQSALLALRRGRELATPEVSHVG